MLWEEDAKKIGALVVTARLFTLLSNCVSGSRERERGSVDAYVYMLRRISMGVVIYAYPP